MRRNRSGRMQSVVHRVGCSAAWVLFAATLSNCMAAPRNNAHIADISSIDVNGLVPWATDPQTSQPGVKVYVDVLLASQNRWWQYGSTTADTSASTTDSGGTSWYRFEMTLQSPLPGNWVGSLANHSMSMKIRSYVHGADHVSPPGPDYTRDTFDEAHDYLLASFDAGDATDQCIRDHANGPGGDIVNACASKAKDVTLLADCGAHAQRCCGSGFPDNAAYQCDSDRCDWTGTCSGCGGAGQIPCLGAQCYPLASGQQRCHLQCDTGAFNGSTELCAPGKPNPPPPPPPPPANTRATHDSSVNCGLQSAITYPLFTCTVLEDPAKKGKLVSITNPMTALQRSVVFVKDASQAVSICADPPSDPSDTRVVTLGPGQKMDLQSMLGSQPDIDGSYTYALCVGNSPIDGSVASAYISNYTESYIP